MLFLLLVSVLIFLLFLPFQMRPTSLVLPLDSLSILRLACRLAPGTVLYTPRNLVGSCFFSSDPRTFKISSILVILLLPVLVHSYSRTLVHSYTRTLVHVMPCFDLFLSRPKTSVFRGAAQSRARVRDDLADASLTRSQTQAELHLVRILSFPCATLASLI